MVDSAVPNSIKWEQIDTLGQVYTPRTGHSVCVNNDTIYLFGGADLEQRTNELYAFNPSK